MTTPTPNGSPLVLVADDEEDILRLVAVRLERAGYEVVTASDGEEALRLILDSSPDLVVLDVRMPGLSGFDVVRRIRENEATSRMPVVLLSASVHEASVAKGLEAGADDYLRKPFSPKELVARVRSLLERS